MLILPEHGQHDGLSVHTSLFHVYLLHLCKLCKVTGV